ncbi:MAG: hypothetical protein ACRD0J_09190, partial [Acidimicrobiales bacterium]
HDDIRVCEYAFVPVVGTGGHRRCSNAVVTPESRCHLHGGDPTASLAGLSAREADALARKELLFAPDPSRWDEPQLRYELLGGQIVGMLENRPATLGRLFSLVSANPRLSPANRLLVAAQHLLAGESAGLGATDDLGLVGWAVSRSAEDHRSAEGWARAGREVDPGAPGVVLTAARPHQALARGPGEDEADFLGRLRSSPASPSVVVSWPKSDTTGGQVEEPESAPAPQPVGRRMDLYLLADRWKASATHGPWPGPAEESHALAHGLGHAVFGHACRGDSPDQEAEAETLAYLALASARSRGGLPSEAWVRHWREARGIQPAWSLRSTRRAAMATSQLMTA